MEDRHISLAHGNGGRYMRELIERIFCRHLANPALDIHLDAAPLALAADLVPFITTDSFTVQPLEFPGGDIGSLAVNGTINDLAVSGAVPRFLTLNAIIEEGLEVACLDRVVKSLAAAAQSAGVCVVAGDTKVVPRGQGGGLYLATTGIGGRQVGNGPDPRRGRAAGQRTYRRPRDLRHAGARRIRTARRGRVGLRGGDAADTADRGDDRRTLHARPHAGRLGHRGA